MSLRALGTRLIATQKTVENTTNFGIVLQGAHEQTHAHIVSCGSGVNDIKTGDIVVVDWNRTLKFTHENTTYYMFDQSAVAAVVN